MLAEALAEYKEHLVTATRRCMVARWSSKLSPEDQSAFNESIEDFAIPTSSLFGIFRKSGADFSIETLRRHRTGECSCQN